MEVLEQTIAAEICCLTESNTNMIIRDFQDYDAIFCGCPCRLPACDTFEVMLFCDLVRADGGVKGFEKEGDSTGTYKKVKTTWSDSPNSNPPATGHITTRSYNTVITVSVEGNQITEPQVQTIDESGGTSFKQPTTVEYQDKVSYADGIDQIKAIMNANIDYDSVSAAIHFEVPIDTNTSLCQAFREEAFDDFRRAQTVSQQAARYKIGWRTEPPPIEPEEPEPLGEVAIKGYYKLSWDLYLMSENYETYLSEIRFFDEMRDRHNAWLECEKLTPGACGPEPIVPDRPTEPQPGPEFIHHREWESVSGVPAFSDSFELPIIDLAPFGDERKNQNNRYVINNMQAACFRSARLGNVPTSFPKPNDFPIEPPIE